VAIPAGEGQQTPRSQAVALQSPSGLALHVSEDLVILDVVNEHDQPMP
jgi:hypothetical protein